MTKMIIRLKNDDDGIIENCGRKPVLMTKLSDPVKYYINQSPLWEQEVATKGLCCLQ